jgi:hypothetical protein
MTQENSDGGTQARFRKETLRRLNNLKKYGESYDDVVNRLYFAYIDHHPLKDEP